MAKRPGKEKDTDDQRWPNIKSFMDQTENSLLVALQSTRALNPDKAMYPLHFACAEGDLTAVKKLVETEDVNQHFLDLPNGSTPLHWAATAQYTTIVSLLLQKGADPNARTKRDHWTPLHIACQFNLIDTITKLVHGGGDPRAEDKYGKIPLDYVMHNPKDKTVNPFYNFLQAQLVDTETAKRTKEKRLKENLEKEYDRLEERAWKHLDVTQISHETQRSALQSHQPSHRPHSPHNQRLLSSRALDASQTLSPATPLPPPDTARGAVLIRVGDQRFQTKRSIIMKSRSSLIAAKLQQLGVGTSHADPGAEIAFDRSPSLFMYVLEHLEHGEIPLPRGLQELRDLQEEAAYYEIPELQRLCAVRLERFHYRRVDPSGEELGERVHGSINEAVEAAEEGEKILLEEGQYSEVLEMSKSLTLISNAPANHRVSIVGNGRGDSTLTVKGASVMLHDVDLVCFREEGQAMAEKSPCCIEVQNGGLLLMEKGSVTGSSDYGMYVHVGGRCNLKDVVIKDVHGTGVTCAGSATMEKCTVARAGMVGVAIIGNGVASIRRCEILESGDCGVLVQDAARGTFTGNEIAKSGLAGVAVSTHSAEAVFRVNTVRENKEAGMLIFNGGAPVISGGSLTQNAVAGLVVLHRSKPRVSSCMIHDNVGCGCLFDDEGLGELRLCEIFGNGLAGLAVKRGANPEVVDCKIRDGKDAGVFVYDGGLSLVSGCQIFNNTLAGVAVSQSGNPTVRSCEVFGGSTGISVVDGGQGYFEELDVYGNATAQVEVVSCRTSPPSFVKCKFRDGGGCGIIARAEGSMNAEDCSVEGNALVGVLVAGSGGTTTLDDCRVEGNKCGGVYVCDGGMGTINRGTIARNEGVGMLVKTGGAPTMVESTVEGNHGAGVWFANKAKGQVERCRLVGNLSCNVLVEGASTPIVKDCAIESAKDCGVLVVRGGRGNFSRNTIKGNRPVGVTIGEDGNPVFFNNALTENAPYGMLILDGGIGQVVHNSYVRNEIAALVLSASSRCVVADNSVNPGVNRVAVCWADEEQKVRAVRPIELQRLGVGEAGRDQLTVSERLRNDGGGHVQSLRQMGRRPATAEGEKKEGRTEEAPSGGAEAGGGGEKEAEEKEVEQARTKAGERAGLEGRAEGGEGAGGKGGDDVEKAIAERLAAIEEKLTDPSAKADASHTQQQLPVQVRTPTPQPALETAEKDEEGQEETAEENGDEKEEEKAGLQKMVMGEGRLMQRKVDEAATAREERREQQQKAEGMGEPFGLTM